MTGNATAERREITGRKDRLRQAARHYARMERAERLLTEDVSGFCRKLKTGVPRDPGPLKPGDQLQRPIQTAAIGIGPAQMPRSALLLGDQSDDCRRDVTGPGGVPELV